MIPFYGNCSYYVTCFGEATLGYATPYVASNKYLKVEVIERSHIIIYPKKSTQRVLFQFPGFHKCYVKSIDHNP